MVTLKTYQKPLILMLIVLAVFAADYRFGWSEYFSEEENLRFLLELVQEDLLQAVGIYMVLTIVGCVVLALPGITFAVLAGLLFGPWLGTLVCLVATTIGAVMAFLVGRYFLHDSIRPLVMKHQWLKKVLFEDAARRDAAMLMITRLVPLFPYNLQNFAYGITDMRLVPYTVYTFLFMLPGVAMFTVGSAGLTAERGRWLYFGAAAGLLVVVFLLGTLVKKRFMNTE